MIQAKELRLGNLTNLGEVKVIEYPNLFYVVDEDNVSFKSTWAKIEPIPLTEEWLVKFGFVAHEHYEGNYNIISNSKQRFLIRTRTDVVQIRLNGRPIINKMPEYVHQLQNLYFALTGEELTINK